MRNFFCTGILMPSHEQPTVAIVILNWNGLSHLQRFLPSVLASTYAQAQVVLADNASSDASVECVQENFPSVRIIRNAVNGGYTGGYNEALKNVEADIFVLLNNDVEVEPGWIEPVVKKMLENEKAGICQPKIRSLNEPSKFEYAGACGGWIDRNFYPFARGRIFDQCEEDAGQYDEPQQCFWASGAALFIKSDLYKKLGGLDESFFAHMEEIDLCWRAQKLGYEVWCIPQSVVYHLGGGTLPKSDRKVYLNYRNNLIMAYKNLSPGERFWKVPLRMSLDAIAVLQSFTGKEPLFKPVLKAHLAFYKWIFRDQKRSLFTSQQQGADIKGVYKGSVVFDYFVRRKRRFSEIVKSR